MRAAILSGALLTCQPDFNEENVLPFGVNAEPEFTEFGC